MPLQASTLRPGLLVSLKTSISGNVRYATNDIEPDHATEDGARRARWETIRTISDAEEHERAVVARAKARNTIATVCTASAFGLLCPENKVADLETAIRDARVIADEFNQMARLTRIGIYVMVGRVEQNDVEAVRAINSEVRDLLTAMQAGVQNLDVKCIRDAADKARQLGAMLSPEASERVQQAIDVARQAARRIVKAGTEAVAEVDQATLRSIETARVAFLDVDHDDDTVTMPEVASMEPEGLAIDMLPPSDDERAPGVNVPQMEID